MLCIVLQTFIMYGSGLRQRMYKWKCNLAKLIAICYCNIFVSLCQVEKGKHVATVDDVEKMKVHVCMHFVYYTPHSLAIMYLLLWITV